MSIKTFTVKLDPKAVHNPTTDIVQIAYDKDSFITYVVETGQCEYFRGRNYVVGSTLNSYSRVYAADKIPAKYVEYYKMAKQAYPLFEQPALDYVTKCVAVEWGVSANFEFKIIGPVGEQNK